jgi:hypothetical protein
MPLFWEMIFGQRDSSLCRVLVARFLPLQRDDQLGEQIPDDDTSLSRSTLSGRPGRNSRSSHFISRGKHVFTIDIDLGNEYHVYCVFTVFIIRLI